jgi:hypothetical protein
MTSSFITDSIIMGISTVRSVSWSERCILFVFCSVGLQCARLDFFHEATVSRLRMSESSSPTGLFCHVCPIVYYVRVDYFRNCERAEFRVGWRSENMHVWFRSRFFHWRLALFVMLSIQIILVPLYISYSVFSNVKFSAFALSSFNYESISIDCSSTKTRRSTDTRLLVVVHVFVLEDQRSVSNTQPQAWLAYIFMTFFQNDVFFRNSIDGTSNQPCRRCRRNCYGLAVWLWRSERAIYLYVFFLFWGFSRRL